METRENKINPNMSGVGSSLLVLIFRRIFLFIRKADLTRCILTLILTDIELACQHWFLDVGATFNCFIKNIKYISTGCTFFPQSDQR